MWAEVVKIQDGRQSLYSKKRYMHNSIHAKEQKNVENKILRHCAINLSPYRLK